MVRSVVTLEDAGTPLDVSTVHPIQDFVLLREIERERTAGGIILPKGKGTETLLCEVVEAGNGLWNDAIMGFLPMELAPGDIVLSIEYFADINSGTRLDLRSGKFRLVRSNGIWAKVWPKDTATYELSKLEPRFTAVLVEPYDEEKTKGGIYFPGGQDKKSELRRAKIIATGPGQYNHKTGKRIPLPYAAGESVLMTRYAGSEVRVNGKEYRLIHDDDVKGGYSE